jgi:hypothetical protein
MYIEIRPLILIRVAGIIRNVSLKPIRVRFNIVEIYLNSILRSGYYCEMDISHTILFMG